MEKLNLKYGEECLIYGTDTELDGVHVNVVGVSSRHIIDIYIVEFTDGKTRITVEDGVDHEFKALTLPESCLDRIRKSSFFEKKDEADEDKTYDESNTPLKSTLFSRTPNLCCDEGGPGISGYDH